MGRAAATISNIDVQTLFEQWGFVPDRGNGGHLVMRHGSGHRVQMTAPGRNTPTPDAALRKAAKVVGVSLSEFKQGPAKKPKRQPRKVVQTRQEVDQQVAADWSAPLMPTEPPRLEARWERPPTPKRSKPTPPPPTGSPSQRVLEVLRRQPGQGLTSAEIVQLGGLTGSQVSAALQYLKRSRTDVVCVDRGVHRYEPQREIEVEPIEVNPEVDIDSPDPLVRLQAIQARIDQGTTEKRNRVVRKAMSTVTIVKPREPVKLPDASTCFHFLGADRTGRMLLQDDEGDLYLANKTFPNLDRTPFL